MAEKKILMVVTSQDRIDDEHPTGLWFEEFARPYYLFRESNFDITVASPKGGPAPIDPGSMKEKKLTDRFADALQVLKASEKLSEIDASDYVAVFFPGGHGAMYDLPADPDVGRIVSSFIAGRKIVAAVCHGPACLIGAKAPDGSPLVKNRKLTSFTNNEEREGKLDRLMPFLLESRLRELGADFEGAGNWTDHIVVDGNLITGQNPQSSESTARAVIEKMQRKAMTV